MSAATKAMMDLQLRFQWKEEERLKALKWVFGAHCYLCFRAACRGSQKESTSV